MFAMKTLALAAGVSLAMFGFAGPVSAAHHHHNGHHHHHSHSHGFGFEFDIPDVYVDTTNDDDAHVAWCDEHRPNYDEDTDMYYSHHQWKPCIAPFD